MDSTDYVKDKEYVYDIKHTRPIILLDCLRKLMVKIINTRLNLFLSNNSILQPNNIAGVQGSSTSEIILKLQTILDHQASTKQTLHILLQDLSKAYDHVDIQLLRIALLRINIPPMIIDFIIKLFSSHKNSIIMHDSVTEAYDLDIGIIQGEIISPLLWIIYYDLMFERINATTYGGYTMTTSLPHHIGQNDYHSLSITTKLLGYLDDTTWSADSIDNLVLHLRIADEFYNLANIKINKHKTKLLTNDPNILKSPTLDLQFGNDIVPIKIVKKNQSERILGVFINMNNSPTPTFNRIKHMLRYVCNSIHRKRITHDHVIYVINRVLILRIEYMTQSVFIPAHICAQFNAIMRSLLKTSLSLPKNFYSSVLHLPIYPNILNIFDHQIRVQASLLNDQFNSRSTSSFLKFAVLFSQERFWTNNIQSSLDNFVSPLPSFTRLESFLYIFKFYSLSFDFNFSFNVRGGNYPISDFLVHPKKFFQFINSIKKQDIFFIDSLLTADGFFLKDWREIKASFKHKGGPTPGWFRFLEEHLLLSQESRRVNFNINGPIIQNPRVTRPKIPNISHDTYNVSQQNKWICYWSDEVKTNVYAKLLTITNYPHHIAMGYGEHFVPDLAIQHPIEATPKSRDTFLQACPGCSLHSTYYVGNDLRPQCIVSQPLQNCFTVNISQQSLPLHNDTRTKRWKLSNAHITNQTLAFNDFLLRMKNRYIPQVNNISSHDVIPSARTHPTIDEPTPMKNKLLIQKLIIPETKHDEIIRLAHMLQPFNSHEFYSDGSLFRQQDGTLPKMGFGLLLSYPTTISLSHYGNLTQWASSTKAKVFAIFMILLICPEDSAITIHTDSQAAIQTFNKLFTSSMTDRRIEKLNNSLVWISIKYLINTLKLRVVLTKVKAHSNDFWNDEADKLAKLGAHDEVVYSINHKGLDTHAAVLKFNDIIVIDRNIRKTLARVVNYRKLHQHLTHASLSTITTLTFDDIIEWKFSALWMAYNPFDRITSRKLSKIISWRLKCSTLSLPTIDILSRNFPELFTDAPLCFLCNDSAESNIHLWQCPATLALLHPLFVAYALKLQALLTTHADHPPAIWNDEIRSCKIFAWVNDDNFVLSSAHPLLALLLNYIPKDLLYPFEAAIDSSKLIKKLLFEYLHELHSDIYQIIWKKRCNMFKEWKTRRNISKKSFSHYQHRKRHQKCKHQSPQMDSLTVTTNSWSYTIPLSVSK